MKSRQQLRNEIAIVTMKVAQAERLGGGFRIYFDGAPTEIMRLIDEDLRHILNGAEAAGSPDGNPHDFVRHLIARLKSRLEGAE